MFLGSAPVDHFDITSLHPIDELPECGVDQVRLRDDDRPISSGTVDVGKRLRPNYRGGKVVLYVSPQDGTSCEWLAERVV